MSEDKAVDISMDLKLEIHCECCDTHLNIKSTEKSRDDIEVYADPCPDCVKDSDYTWALLMDVGQYLSHADEIDKENEKIKALIKYYEDQS